MTEHDGRRWVIVGALFATLFLIWGPLNAGGVFFVPVITHFRMEPRIFFTARRRRAARRRRQQSGRRGAGGSN